MHGDAGSMLLISGNAYGSNNRFNTGKDQIFVLFIQSFTCQMENKSVLLKCL